MFGYTDHLATARMPSKRSSKAPDRPAGRTTSPATASSSSVQPPHRRSSQRGRESERERSQSRRSVRFADEEAGSSAPSPTGKRSTKQTAKKAASTEAARQRTAQAKRQQQLRDRQREDELDETARRILNVGASKAADPSNGEVAQSGEVEHEVVQEVERQQRQKQENTGIIGNEVHAPGEVIQTLSSTGNPPLPQCSFTLRLTLKALTSQASYAKTKWTMPYYPESGGVWYTSGNTTAAPAQISLLFDQAMDQQNFDELIVDIMATVKSDGRLSKREQLSMGLITDESWDKLVQLLESEHQRFPGHKCNVIIDVFGRITATPKRSILEVNSPQASPHRRRTRTTNMEDQSVHRRDVNELAGNMMLSLVEKWCCTSDQCNNESAFCFVHHTGKHYKLNGAQQEQWANVIPQSQQNATINRPPDNLYDYLIQKQGSCASKSRNPITLQQRHERENENKSKVSAFDKLADIMVTRENMKIRREELRIIQDFGGGDDRPPNMGNNPLHIPPYQSPTYIHQYPPPQMYPYYPTPPTAPIPPPPNTAPAPPPPTHASHQIFLDRSSPIAPENEDDQILNDFFHWKRSLMNHRPEIQRRLTFVQEKIQEEMWSVEDVKDMSNETSAVHKRAIALNLPHGLISSFKTQLKEFKQIYRSEYNAGRGLQNLAVS